MLTPRVLLVPNTPTLLIDEQRGTLTPMLTALYEQARRFDDEAPEVIVVATSRWVSAGLFQVDDAKRHQSLIDLPSFGVQPRYDCPGDPTLAREIVDLARRVGLPVANGKRGADSGVAVPLHFISDGNRVPVVPVSLADLDAETHRRFGACLREAIAEYDVRAAFVVSGALTFSEHDFNLRREVREDLELDLRAIEALKAGEWGRLGAAPRTGSKAHPEAGWMHLEVLRGFLGGDYAGRLLAYETVPGIGSALMEFDVAVEGGAAAETRASRED